MSRTTDGAANDDRAENDGAGGIAIAQLQELIETGTEQAGELWRASVPALRRYGPWLALTVVVAGVATYFLLDQLGDEDDGD